MQTSTHFQKLSPYSGEIDQNNRWIRPGELVPWDEMALIYRKHFDDRKSTPQDQDSLAEIQGK
jgi:hypothetical protein